MIPECLFLDTGDLWYKVENPFRACFLFVINYEDMLKKN